MLRRFAFTSGAWRPRRTRSPLAGAFEEFVRRLAEGLATPTPAPAASAFRQALESRLEPRLADGAARMDSVARELGLSRQTLYRRLKAEGLTFEQVVEDLRRRLATAWLEEGLAVKEVAYRTGFADPASFSRAFKRWTGRSPSALRRASPGN